MKFLDNVKVGTKIVILLAVLLLCLGISSGVGMFSMHRMDQQSNFMYMNNLLGLQAANEANIQLISLSRSVRDIALAPQETRHQYIKAYEAIANRTREELQKTGGYLLVPEAKAIHEKTFKAFEDFLVKSQSLVGRIDELSHEQTTQEIRELRPVTDIADGYMTDLGEFLSNAASVRNDDITALSQNSLLLSAAILLASLLAGGILGLLIKKAIADPLIDIAGKSAKVAAGDLEQDFVLDRRDELGTLADALAQMVVNLKERIGEAEQKSREAEEQSRLANTAMGEANTAKEKAEAGQAAILEAAEQVEQVVNRLSAATEELSAQIEQSSRSSDMQRERVGSSATAMEEMNSTVLEVARNAGIASANSDTAKSKALQGEKIVQKSVESISIVQSDTGELRRAMEALGQQAQAIGNIMTVISDIADQTNLLALNAAIEAARAGEAGRGFAVVADEVRKLAEKTMTATKEVGDAIGGIQSGARQSIEAVEKTSQNLDSSTSLVKESGDALRAIVDEVEASSSQVANIATASEQQSAASAEITRSLEEINTMASETATAMRHSAQAVSELALQSQELQTLVNQLRTGKAGK